MATLTEEPPVRRKRGRPRDPGVEDAALGAARALLLEKGMGGCTIAAVAQTAGVGKGTIYLRWPDKESLIVDAMAEGVEDVAHPDTGSIAGDLRAMVDGMTEFLSGERGRLIATTVGELPRYPRLQALYDERVLIPVSGIVAQVLERGRKRGEVRKGIDPVQFADLLFGPLFARLVLWQGDFPKGFGKMIVDVAVEGIRPKK